MEAPDLFAGEAPGSPYAAAKAGQALYAQLFHALYAAPIVSARIFMVYGPGQRDLTKLVPYTILEGLAGRAPQLQNAERALDWIYVDDVARGLAALAKAPAIEGQTLDLGSGTATPVAEVAARIARATGGPTPVNGVSAPLPRALERVADRAATLAATGFAPEVDLDDGLARTVAWYRTWRGRKEPSQVATSSS
jgi:nucleoside-diphosphate-sugar epimerase